MISTSLKPFRGQNIWIRGLNKNSQWASPTFSYGSSPPPPPPLPPPPPPPPPTHTHTHPGQHPLLVDLTETYMTRKNYGILASLKWLSYPALTRTFYNLHCHSKGADTPFYPSCLGLHHNPERAWAQDRLQVKSFSGELPTAITQRVHCGLLLIIRGHWLLWYELERRAF